jgi:O-antigen ligase
VRGAPRRPQNGRAPTPPNSPPAGPRPGAPDRKSGWWGFGDLPLTLAVAGLALVGFNRTRVGDWTLSDLLFLACGGLVVAQLLMRLPRGLAVPLARKSSPPVLIGSVILLTAGTLSAFNSWAPARSFTIVLRFAWLTLLWFWLLRSVSRDREALSRLLLGWRITLLASAVIAILGQAGVLSWSVPNAENRQTAFMPHPNDLGGMLAIGLPIIALGLPLATKPRRHPLAWRAAAVLLVAYALATSGSMSATIGAVAGMASLVFLGLTMGRTSGSRRRSPLVPLLIAFGLVVGGALLVTSDLPVVDRFDRYESGDQGVNSSVGARGASNEAILARYDQTLVVGIGFDSIDPENPLDPALATAAAAHNMYLRIMFQAGLPGLLGLLLVIAFSLRQAWMLCVNTRGDPLHTVCRGLFASAVAGNVFALFQTTQYHRYYWLPLALISVVWAMRRHEIRLAAREQMGDEMAVPAHRKGNGQVTRAVHGAG